MTIFSREWVVANEVRESDSTLPIRQVYVWVVTTDGGVILVSKNGTSWQFPGGKPEAGETNIQTAVREVREETGFDITDYANDLVFYGYFNIIEPEATPEQYLQVRYYVSVPLTMAELVLHVEDEDTVQGEHDAIKFVEAVSLEEAHKRIGWLHESPDYLEVQKLGIVA